MIQKILENDKVVWFAMAFIVFLMTQIAKLPIKAITKRFVKDSNIKARINAIIMLIPIALGIFAQWCYCYYIDVAFHVIEGANIGGVAIVIYSLFEKMIKGDNSQLTKDTKRLFNDIMSDGKVDENDNSAVKEFLDKAK